MKIKRAKMKIKRAKSKTVVIEKFEEIYPETGRKLIRPKINWLRAILLFVVTLMIDTFIYYGVSFFLRKMSVQGRWADVILVVLIVILTLLINAKRIVIFAIRFYQSQAPYTVRCRCLYIPNCSEYMRLAINKYGLIKGVKMGMERFNRCKPPYGGEDYP